MKKLISLLAAISVVSACSLSAFASEFTINGSETNKLTATDAATQTTYEKGDNGLYTVDLSSVAGDQDQTTILAVKGNNIAVGSIQYIGQSADKTFSFDLKDNLTEQVNVLAGGSKISPTLVGNMKPAQTQTGYTISGAVSNFVDKTYLDELSGYVTDLYGEEQVAKYVAGYTTTAYLIEKTEIENYLAYYTGEADSFSFVKKAEVSSESGTFSMTEVPAGEYAIIISRPSALSYMDYITVSNSNITLPTIELALGDVKGYIDWMVDSSDAIQVIQNATDIESEDFDPAFDISPDLMIDSTDAISIIQNSTDIYSYDTDLINDYL